MNLKEQHQARLAAARVEDPGSRPYYVKNCIECIEVLEALGIAPGYCRGNAIKYLWRMNDKNEALADCIKARWYVDRLIGYMQEEAAP